MSATFTPRARPLHHLRNSLLGLCLAGLSGCALLRPTLPQPQPSRIAQQQPSTGEDVTRTIGETLLLAADEWQAPALQAQGQTTLCEDQSKRILLADGQLLVESQTADGDTVFCGEFQWQNKIAGQQITAIQECLQDSGEQGWMLYFNRQHCREALDLKAARKVIASRDNQRRELIYSGRSGQLLFVTYRESTGDKSAADNSLELRFDLNDGDVIGVHGARLQVLDVEGLQIHYRLLSGFSALR